MTHIKQNFEEFHNWNREFVYQLIDGHFYYFSLVITRARRICNYQFWITNYNWNFEFICNELAFPHEFVVYLQSIINFDVIRNFEFICNELAFPHEFVVYLQSIINFDGIRNRFAINCQFRWNLWLICNQLLIPMEFVIDLQSIINFDGICNWFAINYQFRWNSK